MENKNPKQKTFYVFDIDDGVFLGTGDSTSMPENATFDSPLPVPDGKIAYREKNKWKYYNSTFAEIQENGLFQRTVILPDSSVDKNTLIEELPPEENQDYYWDGKNWILKEKPEGIYFPEFKDGEWVETGTKEQINELLDSRTSEMIKAWCKEQGKCEEYYINRGVLNGKDDPEYEKYKSEREVIIKKQKKLKK